MPKKKEKRDNMKLAGLFTLLVLGLIIISVFFKAAFLIRDSKFDGNHKFNVEFITKNKVNVVSFSPINKSLTILLIKEDIDKNNPSKSLGIPIDGKVFLKDDLTKNNLSLILLKSALPWGDRVKDLTVIDLIRLVLFSRTVPEASIYERELSAQFNEVQKSTIISLSFTDPAIYAENQTIEVINATDVYGLGGRLANLISNMGGSVILVSSADKKERISKIIYSGEQTYTVKKLSNYLSFPLEKKDKKSIADVIIVIGIDGVGQSKF